MKNKPIIIKNNQLKFNILLPLLISLLLFNIILYPILDIWNILISQKILILLLELLLIIIYFALSPSGVYFYDNKIIIRALFVSKKIDLKDIGMIEFEEIYITPEMKTLETNKILFLNNKYDKTLPIDIIFSYCFNRDFKAFIKIFSLKYKDIKIGNGLKSLA